jgi:uncharacterized protein YjbI with pentapeptide repeats
MATPARITVQATPTEDATVTALNKEKLQHENDWWWNFGATILTSVISTFTLALAGIFAVVRYFNDRRDTRAKQDEEQQRWLKAQEAEREKRAEERFQAAVEGLSSEREEAKIGAAIVLRTFLRPGYEQFYIQTFDLAVANLRLPRTSQPPADPNTSMPLTTLRQALAVVFKEAFPLARSQNDKRSSQALDASRVQLDNAYLSGADLKGIWMPEASLQNTNFLGADLNGAFLNDTNFCESCLNFANLHRAFLNRANLSDTLLIETNLSEAKFGRTNLMRAHLDRANLSEANLTSANFSGADLSKTNIEHARSLNATNLCRVKGLTKEQLAACKAKGAIIDEDLTLSTSQSTVAPSSPPQSNNAQASSAPPAQESTPTPDPDGSNTASSQPDPES